MAVLVLQHTLLGPGSQVQGLEYGVQSWNQGAVAVTVAVTVAVAVAVVVTVAMAVAVVGEATSRRWGLQVLFRRDTDQGGGDGARGEWVRGEG